MTDLDHCRILVVEDEYMLARHLQRELEYLGAVILGPEPSIRRALDRVAHEARIDVAILDVNLGGELSFPVADALLAQQVPFVFSSGYENSVTRIRYPAVPTCNKPYVIGNLLKVLQALIQDASLNRPGFARGHGL